MTSRLQRSSKFMLFRTFKILTLLSLFFAFSGLASISPAPPSQCARTEWVVSLRVNARSKLSFKKAEVRFSKNYRSVEVDRPALKRIAFHCDRLTGTAFSQMTSLFDAVDHTNLFFHAKTIPQGTDEELLDSCLG